MNNRTKIGSVTRASILLSVLVALSGMAAMAMADPDMDPLPNWFLGNVTLNGEPAPVGTVINASIDGEPRGSIPVESLGEYKYLRVEGSTSDDGKNVTFTVCGANAEPNGTWILRTDQGAQILNLTAEDDVAPAVENANANPASIVANGNDTTQLNVTVIDGCQCTVSNVTVNLSAIGGLEAKEMDRIGDTDVYTVTTNATEGTALGAYCLYVNASDVFGQCNTSVCIALEIVETPTYAKGDLDHNGDVADAVDVAMMLQASVGDITATSEYDLDGNDDNADAVDVAMMLQASVGDITL